jgi:hypothetical protein
MPGRFNFCFYEMKDKTQVIHTKARKEKPFA